MKFLLLAVSTVSLAAAAWAQSARDEASQAQLFSSAPQFLLTCRLTIDDGTGDKKVRDLSLWTTRGSEEERLLVQVTAPAFLKALKFLRVNTKSGEGTWLKTSRGVQRLAPSADPEPLFGSDFTTADFLPGSNDWALVESADPELLILERASEPRLGWSKQVMTLRRTDHLIVRGDFLASDGTLVRRYLVTAFTPTGMPQKVEIQDRKNKRKSELEILTFSTTSSIPASLFLPGNL